MRITKSLDPFLITPAVAAAKFYESISPENFQAMSKWKRMGILMLDKTFHGRSIYSPVNIRSMPDNDYDRTAKTIASGVQCMGRSACGAECGINVELWYANSSKGEALKQIATVCQQNGCPETGLEAAAEAMESMSAEAPEKIAAFRAEMQTPAIKIQ